MAKSFDLGSFAQTLQVSNLGTGGQEQLEYIDIDRIDDDPGNFYAVTKLEELAANIQLCGLQQPIRVRSGEGDRVTIVSGHRRRAALRLLVEEGLEQFRAVPCIREGVEGSQAFRELRLIFANADTRVLSSPEISKQAERVELLLYQLQEEGFAFPGRMRDHVAEACKLSKSKLARLKVIREKLAADWKKLYDDNKLVEATAYALAQLSPEWQAKIMALHGTDKRNIAHLREYDVSRWAKQLGEISKIKCKHGEQTCTNGEAMWEKCTGSTYLCYGTCPRCCESCSENMKCKYLCPKFKDKIAEEKRKQRAENKTEKQKQQEAELAKIAANQQLWTRLGKLRRAKKVSLEEAYTALHGCWRKWEESRWSEKELGTYQLSADGGSSPYYGVSPSGIAALAKLLGVSIEYLFCATDDAAPPAVEADATPVEGEVVPEVQEDAPAPVVASATAAPWQTGTDYPSSAWIVALTDIGNRTPHRCLLYCDYGCFRFSRSGDLIKKLDVLAWWPLPADPENLKLSALEDDEHGLYD